jgi:hypothetical protein
MEIKLKRGDIREDGKVFWGYKKRYKNGQYWMTPEQLEKTRKLTTKANYFWKKQNPERTREIVKKYKKKKRETDFSYLLCDRVRNLTTQAFRVRKYSKKSRTHQLLGCNWDFLKKHIENQFRDGMSWGNRDKWHIDHIIPLAMAKSQKELEKLCHWKNLQPLWAIDNLKKKKKILTNT